MRVSAAMWAGGVQAGGFRDASGRLRIHVESHRGATRRALEDAWRVGVGVATPLGPADVLAVFDGVGGQPNGQAAAEACANALPAALALGDVGRAVQALHEAALQARGATTMTLAIVQDGYASVAQVGDSSLWVVGDAVRLATARHGSGNRLDQALGVGSPQPQYLSLALGGETLLLGTDGVGEPPPDLPGLLAARQVDAAAEAVRMAAHVTGDDATSILAQPR